MARRARRGHEEGRRFLAAGLAALAIACPLSLGAQFRGGTTLVVVDAVVTGSDGNIVRDLKASDFELLVDGATVPIEQAQFVDASVAPPEAHTPAGVFSNAAEPGGVFALVIDDMNLGARGAMQARRRAIEFLQNALQPHDYAAVLRSGVTSTFLFGTDRPRLIALARGATGAGGLGDDSGRINVSASAEADASRSTGSSALAPADAGTGKTPFDAANGLEMVRLAVERLATIPSRRKAVLWFNEGLLFDAAAALANPSGRASDKLRQVIRTAFEGNVAIYPVDPRGLYAGPDASRTGRMPRYGLELDPLRDIARMTGGRAIVNTNSLAAELAGVARENRAYYLLGYAPTGPPEKKWRVQPIELRVKRPGMNVQHRTGFVPLARTPAPALAPVAAPLPIRGLRIAMAPALVGHLSRSPSVVVPFTVLGGLPAGSDATFLVMAVDERGRIGGRQSGRLPPPGDAPLTASPRLSLQPGRYQLRLIVQGIRTGGTVFGDLLVPKSGTSPPACTGVYLEQTGVESASATHAFRGGSQLRMHATVSASAQFAGDAVSATLAHDGSAAPSAVNRTPAGKGWWRLDSTLTLPASPGRYRLTIQAGDGPIDGCLTDIDVAD
jgi:VWFA-related protein